MAPASPEKKSETDQQREPERDRVPERGEAEEATSKAFVLDFETCKEEEKREPQQAQHLDRRVDRNPAQYLRSDHDPEHDLEHDRR